MRRPRVLSLEVDGLGDVGVCAFYFPGREELWDKYFQCGFLGNFYPAQVQLEIGRRAYRFRRLVLELWVG